MAKFLVQLSPADVTSHKLEDFKTVRADGVHNAALVALERAAARGLKLLAPGIVFAYVAPKAGPRHSTGMPMTIHRLTIGLGANV